jgi:hypothetical protein
VGIVFKPEHLASAVFGLFFAGFAMIWMYMASQAMLLFSLMGLPFLFVGVGLVVNPVIGPLMKLRGTWYTLTNQRVFVATKIPFKGRMLQDFTIMPDTSVEFVGNAPSSVHLATVEYDQATNNTYKRRIQLERLNEASEVYRLIRNIINKEGAQ